MQQAKQSFAQQAGASRSRARPTTRRCKARPSRCSSSRPSARRRRRRSGSRSPTSKVQARLDQIKKQYFGGSETKYKAQLKKQDLTDAQVRQDIRSQLISEAVFAKVTTGVKVSPTEVHQLLHDASRSSITGADARRPPHPRQVEAARRLDLRAAEDRQRPDVVHAREEVLAGSELEGQVRQADGLEGPDRAGVRQGRVLGADEGGARAGSQPAQYRLVHHRAGRQREARIDDARGAGRELDQADSCSRRRRTRR